ncbi:hypothetical protein HY085_01610 [Candidatus Gottesmanbacteria bacterium]|nr:hypothetical protein [Candidatus Gottesmanbacteria bacterium]
MRSRYFLLLTIFVGLLSLTVVFFLVRQGVQKPQNVVPSKAAEGDVNKCQGNQNASAKCFDCQKDTGTSIINQLDFASCFKKFYGKDVGTQ